MDVETLTGTTIGFVLAFGFLTHILIPYEDYLDDRKLFIGFGYGFISAVIAYLMEQIGFFSFYIGDIEADSSRAFISIFGIALLHTALKGLSMNHKSLWDGKDMNIPFYGAAYGFTFGAVYVTVIISKTLKGGGVEGIEYLLLFLLSLGMILFQGSTSVLMGYGVPQLKLNGYFLRVSVLHMFMNMFIFISALYPVTSPLMVLMVLSLGTLLYLYCYRVVIPESLTKEQKRELFPEERPVHRRLSRLSAAGQTKK